MILHFVKKKRKHYFEQKARENEIKTFLKNPNFKRKNCIKNTYNVFEYGFALA